MLRSLSTAFFEHGRIHTTLARAKALRPVVEKLMTLGRKQTLHARRLLERYIFKREVCAYVCHELAERFAQRTGGYTRIMKTRLRAGDCAPM